jgi:DNA-binding transcriptional MerR regulator
MRIGALAKAAGTTVRTVRYYEEIGLLPADARQAGEHREYDDSDVERLRELLRLKGLLGLSLEELRDVMQGEAARAERRRVFKQSTDPVERARLLREAIAHTDSLLELVRRRKGELEEFEAELNERRQRGTHALKELVS